MTKPRKTKPQMFSQSDLEPDAVPEEIKQRDRKLAEQRGYHHPNNAQLVLAVKSADSDRMLDLSVKLGPGSVTRVAIGDIVEDVPTENLLKAADIIRRHLGKYLPAETRTP